MFRQYKIVVHDRDHVQYVGHIGHVLRIGNLHMTLRYPSHEARTVLCNVICLLTGMRQYYIKRKAQTVKL